MISQNWMDSIPSRTCDAPSATSLLIRVTDHLLTWLERAHGRRVLATLDERMLADIGVDHATARMESRKPFWKG